MTSIIIAGVIGFALGFAIAWAFAVSRRTPSESSSDGGSAVLREELNTTKVENLRLHNALELAGRNAASAEEGRRNAEENVRILTDAEARMKEAFAKAANDALTASRSVFLDLA